MSKSKNPVQEEYDALMKTKIKIPKGRNLPYTRDFYCKVHALANVYKNEIDAIKKAVDTQFDIETLVPYDQVKFDVELQKRRNIAKELYTILQDLEEISPLSYPKTLEDAVFYDWKEKLYGLNRLLGDYDLEVQAEFLACEAEKLKEKAPDLMIDAGPETLKEKLKATLKYEASLVATVIGLLEQLGK